MTVAYQLVFQLPFSSTGDYDAMVSLEGRIARELGALGDVDGHDAGTGQMNVFVHTGRPEAAFERVARALWPGGLPPGLKVAFRPLDGDAYTVLHPPGEVDFVVA